MSVAVDRLARLFFLWISLLCSVPSGSVQADARGADSAEYREVIEQAVREFRLSHWEEAAALFDRAHRLAPSARTLRGMGLTAFEARRYVDALRHLRAALKDTRRPLTEGQQRQVRQVIERSKTFVATIQLSVAPTDAEVRLDGQRVKLDEMGEVLVDPGPHELSVSAPGWEGVVRRVRAVSGKRLELDIRLPSRDGTGASPMDAAAHPRTAIDPAADAAPGESRSRLRRWAYASGALAVAASVGTGAAFAVRRSALGEWNDDTRCLQPELTRQEACGSAKDRADSAQKAGIGLAAVAGVAGVTSLVLFLVKPSTPEVARACTAGPGEVGLRCRVRF